jgi:hypothetical protein
VRGEDRVGLGGAKEATSWLLGVWIILGLVILAVQGCGGDGTGCYSREVVGCAGRLIAPDSGRVGQVVAVRVSGTIGPTLCSHFTRIDVRWLDEMTVRLKAIGEVRICDGLSCPALSARFDEVVELVLRSSGWIRIEVVSDDCLSIVDSTLVLPSDH